MVFKSPWPSLKPYAPLTVSQVIEASVRQRPDKTALMTVEGRAYTFGEFWAAVRGMARALQDEGVRKGDVVGIYAPNSIEYAVALHGSLLAGATVTTLNPLYREREVEHQLHDAGAKVVFTLGPLASVVHEAKANVPQLQHVHELEGAWEMARDAGGEPAPVPLNPTRDIAVLPYSSGTTGLPKGVMLSHQNLSANIRQTIVLDMTGESGVVLDFLPFYHIYGMMVLLNVGLAVGATQIILPRFDPEAAMGIIQQHRVTDLYCVPPAVLALANQPRLDEYDMSSLRFLMSGAAPLPLEVGRQAQARLGCTVMQGYGMTETAPVITLNQYGREKLGTVGRPLNGVELRLSADGEILTRGPHVMLGYYNDPAATEVRDS